MYPYGVVVERGVVARGRDVFFATFILEVSIRAFHANVNRVLSYRGHP